MGLANVGGVFVVLMGGMGKFQIVVVCDLIVLMIYCIYFVGIACVIAVCEFVWKSRKVAIEEKVMKLPQQSSYPSLLQRN